MNGQERSSDLSFPAFLLSSFHALSQKPRRQELGDLLGVGLGGGGFRALFYWSNSPHDSLDVIEEFLIRKAGIQEGLIFLSFPSFKAL